MKKIFSTVLRGFFISYALTAVFSAPINASFYDEKIDYITASIYELLGKYSISFILVWFMAAGFILLLDRYFNELPKSENTSEKPVVYGAWGIIISIVFGISAGAGRFFYEIGTEYVLFGSVVNFIKVVFVCAGYSFLLYIVGQLFFMLLTGRLKRYKKGGFLSDGQTFWKSFLIMAVFYLPFLILSFPGGLCFDGIGQMEQVLSGSFNKHHPLMHTLVMGGLVKLGDSLHCPELGIFIYVVLQTLLLISAFSLSLKVLAKRNVPEIVIRILLALFCLTPIYTNLATTAIKDVPFGAFVLIYVILLSEICLEGKLPSGKKAIYFILIQLLVILFRNNGLPLVVLTGIGAVILFGAKEKKCFVKKLLYFFGVSFVASIVITEVLTFTLKAASGSKGEILSLPFQQTAYTLQKKADSFSEYELTAIEGVLGDPERIAEAYDPLISDPVKMHYDKSSGFSENMNYLGAYLVGGIKHPFCYIKAFNVHVYGWFCVSVPNGIRYEVDDSEFRTGMLFNGADKVMIFLYRFANRFSPLGLLENIGVYVFVLSIITVFLIKNKRKLLLVATFPAWVSLLICMASPCFYQHPRYALPIFMSVPYLFALFSEYKDKEVTKKGE